MSSHMKTQYFEEQKALETADAELRKSLKFIIDFESSSQRAMEVRSIKGFLEAYSQKIGETLYLIMKTPMLNLNYSPFSYVEIQKNKELYSREISFTPFMVRRLRNFRDIYQSLGSVTKDSISMPHFVGALLKSISKQSICPLLKYELLETMKLIYREEFFQMIILTSSFRELFMNALSHCIQEALCLEVYHQSIAYETISLACDMLCPNKLSDREMVSCGDSLRLLLPEIMKKYPRIAKKKQAILSL